MSGQEWRLQASCRFDPDGPFLTGPDQVAFIGVVCSQCPVKAECLAEDPEGFELGVYGGLTKRERQAAARKAKPNNRLAPCGTEAAYQRHCRWKEAACEPCKRVHSERVVEMRRRRMARRAALNPATVADLCGTTRGYRRHGRRREESCAACRRAWTDYVVQRRNARAAA